jgi:hypothetical protein
LRRFACSFAEKVAWEVECRKPPMLLCMGLKICLDEDLYRFLAGIYFHSDRVVAKVYLIPTTVLPSNNRMRHFLTPILKAPPRTYFLRGTFLSIVRATWI